MDSSLSCNRRGRSLPIQVAPAPSNFGRYDAFLYKDWRYPLDARNKTENKYGRTNTAVEIPRVVEPTYLCFIDFENHEKIMWSSVSKWRQAHGDATPTDYVFVSFIGVQSESSGYRGFDNRFLGKVGKHAAKKAGASAYWVSKSCLFNREGEKEEKERLKKEGTIWTESDTVRVAEKNRLEKERNIWTISDIVRRAKAVAVVVAEDPYNDEAYDTALQEWGDRVWTMPELLLYTGNQDISIYKHNNKKSPEEPLDEPRETPRRELWSETWSDTALSGQLLDHYENSLVLSPLELVTVALRCLYGRKHKEYKEGDMSYALMGFLRQRPSVVITDNDFQAFARLSLANDSNLLMERMICLLPKSLDEKWWSLDDAWDVMLWDIYPKTQICGIGDNNTVILDGARGAAIRWDKFVPVLTLGQESTRHKLARWVLRTMPALFIVALLSVIIGAVVNFDPIIRAVVNFDPIIGLGAGLLVLSGVVIFASPNLTRLIYQTKVHDSQPFFFGMEGYLDIHELELLIFGSLEGRLQWSTASSPLSHHDLDRQGMKRDFLKEDTPEVAERIMKSENMFSGLDPVQSHETTKELVEKAKTTTNHLDKKIFTLIDTYTMTVTLFEAVRPPVAVLICGAEGGMQRALLCSQDWTSGTLYRETVLRMETRVKDRMDTMARVRLGLRRDDKRDDPTEFKFHKFGGRDASFV
ncbi:MAG: hypothetical protein Q9172_006334 [Xanthocarpia lactea]